MNKFLVKLGLLTLLAMGMAATPISLRAQNTNTAAAPEKKPSHRVLPFHGKLKSIDNTAKTISVGTETIQITSETIITKAGKPATLEDGTAGDTVAGAYRKDTEGKLNAVSLRFAPTIPASNTKTNMP
jgi:hypothetical protein